MADLLEVVAIFAMHNHALFMGNIANNVVALHGCAAAGKGSEDVINTVYQNGGFVGGFLRWIVGAES